VYSNLGTNTAVGTTIIGANNGELCSETK